MIYQVNKVLLQRTILRKFFRYAHNEYHSSKILYPLESRKILKVRGSEAAVFLQGLITNDIRHFEDGAKSMYAMFLNNKGRVLYDTIIHATEETDSFLLECDKNITSQLLRHLKLFKLKRKIDIADASQDYKIWALISPSSSSSVISAPENKISISKDPRIAELGYRILCHTSVDNSQLPDVIGKDTVIEKSEEGYKLLRYKLGVSEGADDLPPGTAFPLEANCDYLHGVSFHKGCYIGQELTARVHHTGVVRKRIMPLKFSTDVRDVQENSVISDSSKPKSNVGKLKGVIQNYGLGLIRVKEAMEAKSLQIGSHMLEVVKPGWWPKEAPKEKAALNKLMAE